jgi:hypothetical protein
MTVWLPFFTMGTLTVTIYSAYFGFGYVGFFGFVGANFAVAWYWNKARKHARSGALFDDRLSSEKMDSAREWWMNKNTDEDS